MVSGLSIRPARLSDAPVLAALNLLAGGGVYQFLYDDRPGEPGAAELMARSVLSADGALSWTRALVAEIGGQVAGGLTHQPYDAMPPAGVEATVPADRTALVAPIQAMGAPGSWFINTIAAGDRFAGRGVGRALLAAADAVARRDGYDRLSLRVFADNTGAIRLYEKTGFTVAGSVDVPHHDRFSRPGGVWLMVRENEIRSRSDGHF